MVGGGSLPEQSLSTWLLAVDHDAPERLAARLRLQRPAAVARVQDGRLVLDLRTVLPAQDAILARQLLTAWRAMEGEIA